MKRHPVLRPLSREHHQYLMWCRSVRWVEEGSPRAPALETVLAELRGQVPSIEAHFRSEETAVFPYSVTLLGEAGEAAVARLYQEHARWRQQLPGALDGAAEDIELLAALARLLHDHIRYEERVFFPLLQAHVDEARWLEFASRLAR